MRQVRGNLLLVDTADWNSDRKYNYGGTVSIKCKEFSNILLLQY